MWESCEFDDEATVALLRRRCGAQPSSPGERGGKDVGPRLARTKASAPQATMDASAPPSDKTVDEQRDARASPPDTWAVPRRLAKDGCSDKQAAAFDVEALVRRARRIQSRIPL